MAFRLSYGDRAAIAEIIAQQRGYFSGKISKESIQRALRRIDAAAAAGKPIPSRNPVEREALRAIYATDGLQIDNPMPLPEGWIGEEADEGSEGAESAFAIAASAEEARAMAQSIIEEANSDIKAAEVAIEEAGATSGRKRRRDSPILYQAFYVEYVGIELVRTGEEVTVYDPFEGDYERRIPRNDLQQVWALYRVGYTVQTRVYL